jgi:branched-chain amino acid transport system permease protein
VKIILESIVLGILTGSVYAVMASGLTLIFGVLDIIDVAHAILVILGAYLTYELQVYLHIDIFVSLVFTMPFMFLLGVGIQWAIIRRIKRDRIVLSLLAMYALALMLEGVENFVFSARFVQLHAPYIDASFPILGFYLPYIYIFCFILSIILLTLLFWLVYRTKFGYALRALTQNRVAAELLGIDVEKIAAITFGIGVALAGAGGISFGATNAFNAASSFDLISRLFVIIVLGGMGSLRGALIASFAMLIIEDVTAVVWNPVWSSTVFFILLVVFLVFRPQGLFGLAQGRKQ